MKKNIPAISIIIPMYNAEKYIGECLDSIFAQTFDDYEVILVDDCSTDNSCQIAESYLPKFNRGGVEKLKLIRSKVNSGGCVGTPRNKGIKIAQGKYLYFVDSDDALLENTLEIFYNAAENFQADFVHAERWVDTEGEIIPVDRRLLIPKVTPMTKPVEKPQFLPEGLLNHVKLFSQKIFLSMPWLYFMRRDLLIDNNIEFPETRVADDQIFDFFISCYAKKILRIPSAVYIRRLTKDSMTRARLDVPKTVHRWIASLCKNTVLLDKFMNRFEELRNNSTLKYAIFERFFIDFSGFTLELYAQIPAPQLDELIRRELDEIGTNSALTAFLFSRMNVFYLQLMQAQQMLMQKDAQIQELKKQLESLR